MPPPIFNFPLQSSSVPRMLAASQQSQTHATCLYAGRSCQYPRATKLSGGLHRFCDYHRKRHNSFQRAYQKRRQSRHDHYKELSDVWGRTSDPLGDSPTTVARPPGQIFAPTYVELSSDSTGRPILGDDAIFLNSQFAATCHHEPLELLGSADNPEQEFDAFLSTVIEVDRFSR